METEEAMEHEESFTEEPEPFTIQVQSGSSFKKKSITITQGGNLYLLPISQDHCKALIKLFPNIPQEG